MNLLSLHKIARPGDGLAPALLHLLSIREARSADTRIVPLRCFNPAIPDIAGASPDRPEADSQRTLGGQRQLRRGHPSG